MQDAYLDSLITTEITEQATNYVEAVHSSITDTYFKEMLIALRVYILVCLDNQSEPDDIFATKKTDYKEMFKEVLENAESKQSASESKSTLSFPMERA